ncbi:hypothetical protein [Kaarinaea lacus]
MSESLLISVLSLAELALVTTGVAIFLFIRNKKLSQQQTVQAEVPASIVEAPEIPSLSDQLDSLIEHTKKQMQSLPEEQAQILQRRIDYLENEVAAAADENSPDYWDNMCERLKALSPPAAPSAVEPEQTVEEPPQDEGPVLNELDDIDVSDNFDDIPILEDKVDHGDEGAKEPNITIETANDDIRRLRSIISRQHDSMDELKKSLSQKDIDLETNAQLAKKLEEVEVAQAQLNMCVETLERENERLNEMLGEFENSPNTEEFNNTKQQLEEAQERITNLERENTLQAERIESLEHEITDLETQLQQRTEEFERIKSSEVDLSQTDDTSSDSQDPDTLLQEIESLTDLITQKSEELSRLQNQQTDDFENFVNESDLPEINLDEDTEVGADKAVGQE